VCNCVAHYFDLDCSKSSTLLKFEDPEETVVQPYTWSYFYFKISSFDSDIKLTFKKDEGAVSISFKFLDENNFLLANFKTRDDGFELKASKKSAVFHITDPMLKRHSGDTLIVGTYNKESDPLSIEVELEFSSKFSKSSL